MYIHVVSVAGLLILRQSATGVTKPSDVMGFRLGRLNAPRGTGKEEGQKKRKAKGCFYTYLNINNKNRCKSNIYNRHL